MGRMPINDHSLVAIALLLLLSISNGNANISVVNGGYEGVVVAIGKELQNNLCQTYINNIKNMINDSSVLLNSATMEKLFFSKIIILIPEDWSCDGVTVEETPTGITFEDAHVRIQKSHPVFFDNPWTEQPRGCGYPGNFIYFSDTFLSATNHTLGSPGKVFVHEWAKFRWGVFEEFGHFGDPVFPSMYHNGSTWKPNYCTDGEVQGESDCTDGSNAADCKFTPNLLQQNLTSSLLATPFVQTVVTFCNQSNHVSNALTKHNLMCGGKSTWEIISNHSDITDTRPGRVMTDVVYSIQKMVPTASNEKVVFVLDISKAMGAKKYRWAYLRDSVQQFILVKATAYSQVGIVTFGNSFHNTTELLTLRSEAERQQLVDAIPVNTTQDTIKNVPIGLSKAAELLGKDGSIILITENLVEAANTAGAMLNAANGLAVQPILYPASPSITTDPYIPVAALHGNSPYIITDNSTDNPLGAQNVVNLFSLTHYIQLAARPSSEEVSSGNCTFSSLSRQEHCITELSVSNSSNYKSDFIIEVLRESRHSESMDFSVSDPNGNVMQIDTKIPSSVICKGNGLQNGKYTVITSSIGGISTETKATLSAVVFQNITQLRIDVFASKPLQELAFTAESAPILYAKLSDGSRSVVFAEVIATIMSPNSNQTTRTSTLRLQDNGVGGDVTGNDGIYSSYILGITELGRVAISISANYNNGTAKFVGAALSRAAPVNPEGLSHACCGSRLNLEGVTLEPTGPFIATTPPGLNGQTSGDVTINYPPSRITDLSAIRKNDIVILSFAASGEDFNIGQASFYILDDGAGFKKTLNKSEPAGTAISEEVHIKCDTLYTFTVTAADSSNNTSPPSNEARVFVSCKAIIDPGTESLSGGAIAGIVIGCLLFVLILILIVCLCLKRDKKDESRLWKVVTCRCCKRKSNTSHHQGRSRAGHQADVIRATPGPIRQTGEVYGEDVRSGVSAPTPIRNIEDMYGKPDMEAKWNARNKKREDSDDDGGFRTQNSRQEHLRMRNMNDDYARHPANQVGLPPSTRGSRSSFSTSHDNFGYSDTESNSRPSGNTTYGNKKPMIPPRKPVTQV